MDALQGCDLTEEFVLSRSGALGGRGPQVEDGDPCDWPGDLDQQPPPHRRMFLHDLEVDPEGGRGTGGSSPTEGEGGDNCSEDNCSYSVDQESYSSDSDHDLEGGGA